MLRKTMKINCSHRLQTISPLLGRRFPRFRISRGNMAHSYFSFVLVLCITMAMGHHIDDKLYKHMCDDDRTYRQELIKCLNGMPREDQMIFQACGMSLKKNSAEDFGVIIQDMCDDETYAKKTVTCISEVHHLIYHVERDEPAHHHPDDVDDDHPNFDFGHDIYNAECFQRLYKTHQ